MTKREHHLIILCASKSWGGLEMNTLRLAEWLSETNSVVLFCVKDSPLASAAGKSFVKTEYFPKPSKSFPLQTAWTLKNRLSDLRTNCLLIVDNKDMSLGAWIKTFSCGKIKLIYQQHMRVGINKKDIIHTLRYQKLDAWVSPLHSLAEETKQRTNIKKSKVHVIPLGLDVEKLQAKIKTKEAAKAFFEIKNTGRALFGVLGRIDRLKNQHILLEAIQKLKQQEILVNALVVGEPTRNSTDNYFGEIKQFISQNGLEEQMMIRPFTNEIENFFGAIDYFVIPTDGETYGMVTLEAMTYGVPVLASRSGGSVEILDNGNLGTFFEVRNSEDLAKQMKQVLQNETEIQRKAEKAKQEVETRYNHRYECAEFNKLMDSLLKGK